VDNRGGARAMVRHLAALGHRRIAVVAGPRGNFDADERLLGYRQELAALGLEASAELEFEGDFTEAGGHLAARRWLAMTERPTAVFAANDATAIGFLSAVAAAGLAVPRDVALGGFDDIPLARLLSPPLTTVRVPIAELGTRAVERLFAALAGEEAGPPADETVATELIARASSAPPSGNRTKENEP
jgi:LacI family transcriptional regulator